MRRLRESRLYGSARSQNYLEDCARQVIGVLRVRAEAEIAGMEGNPAAQIVDGAVEASAGELRVSVGAAASERYGSVQRQVVRSTDTESVVAGLGLLRLFQRRDDRHVHVGVRIVIVAREPPAFERIRR